MDIIIVPNDEGLMSLQAVLQQEVRSNPGWAGMVDLRCVGDAIRLAAVIDGEIGGTAVICYFDEGSCEMHKLYVSPLHRWRGVARRLVGEVERIACDGGWLDIGIEISGGSQSFWTAYLRDREVEALGGGKFIFQARC